MVLLEKLKIYLKKYIVRFNYLFFKLFGLTYGQKMIKSLLKESSIENVFILFHWNKKSCFVLINYSRKTIRNHVEY